jgi:hypothetical protein
VGKRFLICGNVFPRKVNFFSHSFSVALSLGAHIPNCLKLLEKDNRIKQALPAQMLLSLEQHRLGKFNESCALTVLRLGLAGLEGLRKKLRGQREWLLSPLNEKRKQRRVCAFPMIDAQAWREGASPMIITSRRDEGVQIAGPVVKDEKTGSGFLSGPVHGENSLMLNTP